MTIEGSAAVRLNFKYTFCLDAIVFSLVIRSDTAMIGTHFLSSYTNRLALRSSFRTCLKIGVYVSLAFFINVAFAQIQP